MLADRQTDTVIALLQPSTTGDEVRTAAVS